MWISKKDYDELVERIKKLEAAANLDSGIKKTANICYGGYFDTYTYRAENDVPVSEVLKQVLDHLKLDIKYVKEGFSIGKKK